MGLFNWIRSELIDIIEFVDNTRNTIVYRFERHDNEIKNNAKLIVREGQTAVFINEGKLADVFAPGTHTLNTANLPILSTLQGWKYGFDSPFKAEVYFVSTKVFLDQKWGTKSSITIADERFGLVDIRAFGIYSFRITDAGLFIREVVGTNQQFTTEHINQQLRSIIVSRFTDSAGESNIPIEKYAANLSELSEAIFGYMKDDFAAYGIDIANFLIENVSMPDEVKKEIFELSRLEKVDLDKLAKMKAAKAMEIAAANPSGVAGMGLGMGMGMGMAGQMTQAMNQQPATSNAASAAPSLSYFVAIDGQQLGPFDSHTLKEMVEKQSINKDTLIWRKGLTDWSTAGKQPDLEYLWTLLPPPLPKP